MHPMTARVWARTGANGVVLESFKIGGRRFTTVEAIARFRERCTFGQSVETTSDVKRRKREYEIAMMEIEFLNPSKTRRIAACREQRLDHVA